MVVTFSVVPKVTWGLDVWLWLDFFLCFLLSHTPVAAPFVSTRSWCDLLNSHWLQLVFQSPTGFFFFFFRSFCNCTVLSAKYSWVLTSSALRDYIVDLSLSVCLLCDSTVQHGQYEGSSALLNFSKWYLVTPAQHRCIHFWHTPSQKKASSVLVFNFNHFLATDITDGLHSGHGDSTTWWQNHLVLVSKIIIWRTIKNILRN